MKMMKCVLAGACAAMISALVAAPALAAPGDKTAATHPVIVVFKDRANLQGFRGRFRHDARRHEKPEHWGYIDEDVGGAVKYYEDRHGFRAEHAYSAALAGFSARLTARQIDELENDPLVDFVEADSVMSINAQTLPWGIDRIDADLSSTRAGDGVGAVTNVNVYVIDTGVAKVADLNVVKQVNYAGDGNLNDCNGHGTHVAGTIAARDNTADVVGVVPGAPVTGIKVLNCQGQGFTSTVIKGVDWVTKNRKKPAVANMSLGGPISVALENAITKSVNAGVFYVVAAGNEGLDACTRSPARLGTMNGVMTVAATDTSNNDPSWSNFGACVDVWAPGDGIQSLWYLGGTATGSGTSMASPHGAGTGALFLSRNTAATPATVEGQIKVDATATGTTSNGGQAIRRLNAARY